LKYGTVFSLTWTVTPVRGLCPMRAPRCFTEKASAETTQLDALAASQSAGDLVEYRRHDQLHVRHAQMRMAGGKFRDEVRSGQRWLRANTNPPKH
jgi:hypothetical protein